MTTKKDFILAAQTISAITDKVQKEQIAQNYCTIFSKQNTRFDTVKFLKACNL
jgi:hypothetical protein